MPPRRLLLSGREGGDYATGCNGSMEAFAEMEMAGPISRRQHQIEQNRRNLIFPDMLGPLGLIIKKCGVGLAGYLLTDVLAVVVTGVFISHRFCAETARRLSQVNQSRSILLPDVLH